MATRINLVPNPNYRKSGTKSYVHLMRKYRFHPTLDGPYYFGSTLEQSGRVFTDMRVGGKARVRQVLRKKLADGKTGLVDAEDIQNDTMYLAPIDIGTPAKKFMLDFDTGSSDLWIWSTELPAKVQSEGKGHAIFDPSKSKTFQNSPTSSWFIMYGDGSSASGTVGTDDVTIGGITIKDQSIELADQLFTSFVQGAGDGLLGLAFSSINTVRPFHVDTAVANMISQHLVPTTAELFTVKLTGYRDTTTAGSATTATAAAEQAQSFYTFGFIDEPTVKATGQEIQYAPINNMMGLWMFSSSSASVNGETIDRFWNHAIADTGTTLALVDDHTCKKIYDAIPGGKYDSDVQGYVFPDDTPTDKLPVVEFAVGDHMFAVHKEDLKFAEAKPGLVYGGVQSRGSMGFDILGDTFLKGVYAVFDVGNLRFGAVQR